MTTTRHVAVLGAGVIGVTTAYYLAKAGCRVTLIDRAASAATEGSHANGGTLSSFHANSWANPKAPLNLLTSMFKRNSIFRFKLRTEPEFLLWITQFLRFCLPRATRHADARLQELVLETQSLLKEILEHTSINASVTSGGMYLIETGDKFLKMSSRLANHPTAIMLDRRELLQKEPALSRSQIHFAGAAFVEQDYSADCFNFTTLLLGHIQANFDVQTYLNTTVSGFLQSASGVCGVQTTKGPVEADDIVVCLGPHTSRLTREIDYAPPIYPIKGYSLSLPILSSGLSPKHFAVDEKAFVAYSNLGNTFRLATFVEFAGYDTSVDPGAIAFLSRYANALAPKAFDHSATQGHACLRPMTPDGAPIIGPIPGHSNIWINSGHGHKGWGASCASAKRISDQMLRC